MADQYDARRAVLRRRVEEAFADEQHPGASAIVWPNVHRDPEQEEFRECLRDKNWRDIDLDFLQENLIHDIFTSFVSDEGFRYYLPAYMIILLDDWDRADLMPDNFLHHLIAPFDLPGEYRDDWLAWTGGLSDGQKQVIVAFLEFVCDAYPEEYEAQTAEDALCSFWWDGLQKPTT